MSLVKTFNLLFISSQIKTLNQVITKKSSKYKYNEVSFDKMLYSTLKRYNQKYKICYKSEIL